MKWKKIGKILIIDENLEDSYNTRFDELSNKFNVDTIAKILKIDGQMRQPIIELLYGKNTETIHKENGCLFKLDIAKVMWSKANTTERMRIANLVKENEVVADMFAGIGYFSIPIAYHSKAKKVFSIEINPDSYYYLNENIELNKLNKANKNTNKTTNKTTNTNKNTNKTTNNDKIQAILGDSAEIAPKLSADRVLMGHVKTTHEFLN